MSLEAWGDEGNVPVDWEDTAMRQEWDELRVKHNKWRERYKNAGLNDVGDGVLDIINMLFDILEDQHMSGKFD